MSNFHIDEGMRLHDKLKAETFTMGQFARSDASEQAVKLLDALTTAYALDLVRVAPEGLIRLQSALQQAQLLRAILMGEALDTPKI